MVGSLFSDSTEVLVTLVSTVQHNLSLREPRYNEDSLFYSQEFRTEANDWLLSFLLYYLQPTVWREKK